MVNRDRLLAELTPDVVVAVETLERHGFAPPWSDIAWLIAQRVGQALRFSEGEGGVSAPIRKILLDRYGRSPAVVALAAELPTTRRWSATLVAPAIAAYFGLDNAEGLRQSMPPGDPR